MGGPPLVASGRKSMDKIHDKPYPEVGLIYCYGNKKMSVQ